MKHARKDYDRIQDPALSDPSLLAPGASAIGEDEPVMLFRAKDKHFVAVLRAYRKMVLDDPETTNDQFKLFLETISDHVDLALNWQDEHGCKTPDLPAS